MKHLYNIGYYSHEESCYRQYWHEQKFSENELRNIVTECLWAGLAAIRDPKSLYSHEREPTLQQCYDAKEFEIALADHGFVKAEFAARVSLFGWARARVPGDWAGHHNDNDILEKLARKSDEKGTP